MRADSLDTAVGGAAGANCQAAALSGQDEEVDTPYEMSRALGSGRRRDASNSALNRALIFRSFSPAYCFSNICV